MLLQLISVLGALMVLSAYGLIQGGVWRELNAGYLVLNIVGSDSFSWSLRGPALDWSGRQGHEGQTYRELTRFG